jgi:hypothetical protein
MAGTLAGNALIDRRPPRVLFSELVAGALERTRVRPTPLATAYLVDLLDERVKEVLVAPDPAGEEPPLAEGLLRARLERGADRIRKLRGLGDRALFVAGFFGDSLERTVVGLGWYRDAGRQAYAELSASLRGRVAGAREPAHGGGVTVPELFEELADRFPEFADVLTEVGDQTRASSPGGLEGLYARFLRTGAERDRRRLVRRGHSVPGGGIPRAQ